jgi:hypothetical protein
LVAIVKIRLISAYLVSSSLGNVRYIYYDVTYLKGVQNVKSSNLIKLVGLVDPYIVLLY